MIARAGLAALALLATATDDPLAGRAAGDPVDCIDVQLAHDVQVIDRHMILYRETDRRIWQTGPDGRCTDLEPSATLVVIDQFGERLCRGDRFRVRRQGVSVPGPICRFSHFTPYAKR